MAENGGFVPPKTFSQNQLLFRKIIFAKSTLKLNDYDTRLG